jgi:hypothetical protein
MKGSTLVSACIVAAVGLGAVAFGLPGLNQRPDSSPKVSARPPGKVKLCVTCRPGGCLKE